MTVREAGGLLPAQRLALAAYRLPRTWMNETRAEPRWSAWPRMTWRVEALAMPRIFVYHRLYCQVALFLMAWLTASRMLSSWAPIRRDLIT